MNESLKAKTFSNIGYNSITRIATLIFQVVGNVVLTRILTPADYGIVGFATIFTSFLWQFSDLGLGSALINRHELGDDALYTAFTLRCFLGLSIYLVAFLIAPFANTFLENPVVVDVVKILSLSFIINVFMFLPNAILTKELNFKKISFCNTATVFVQSTIAIILALKGIGYWSIVLANVSSAIFMVILINIIKPIKLKFMFNRTIADQLLNYGGNIFASGLLVFLIFNFDNFAIGSMAGATQLGYYSIAFNWGAMICTLSGSVILSVLFPTFSKMNGDMQRIKTAYLRILEYLAFAGVLANLILLVISKDFLVHVLGHGTDKWIPALSAFQILCVYGIIRTLLEPIGSVIMAIGKTEIIRKASLIVAFIEVSMLYPVIQMAGIVGVAILVTVAYSSQYLIYYPFISKELAVTSSELKIILMPLLAASAALLISLYYFSSYAGSSFVVIFVKVTIACAVYVCTHGLCTNWKILKELHGIVYTS